MIDKIKKSSILNSCEFVVMAPNSWFGQWMNRQQLFSRIGVYSKVIYSKGLPYTWELKKYSSVLSSPIGGVELDSNVLVDEPSSLLVRWKKYPLFERLVLKLHIWQLLSRLDDNKYRILYIFHPNYIDYVDLIPHDILVYHPYDDFLKQGDSNKDIKIIESKLIAKADMVFAPSVGITENLKKRYNRQNIQTILNGVDFSSFSSAQKNSTHTEIEKIKRPRIGYIGSINKKVDFELLCLLSEKFSFASIILVGPLGNMGEKQEAFEQLCRRKNVHILGERHYSELPSIASGMDCHLLCYDTSPKLWAKYSYPLKLNECLATKIPTVSCDLPSIEGLASMVDVAFSPEDWIKSINRILAGDNAKTEKGYEYASKQDWSNRVDLVAGLIEMYIQSKSKGLNGAK